MGDYGARIKAAREGANLTQEQLGDLIGVTGVTITRYEKNQREPRIKQIAAIAKAVNVPAAYLMGCVGDDGAVDLGLVAIELSKIIGIDRAIVFAALERVAPEDPFAEESIDSVRKVANELQVKETISKSLSIQAKATDKRLFNIAEQILWQMSYGARAVAEIQESIKMLNEDGQREAVKRVAELTEIPKYQKQTEAVDSSENKE